MQLASRTLDVNLDYVHGWFTITLVWGVHLDLQVGLCSWTCLEHAAQLHPRARVRASRCHKRAAAPARSWAPRTAFHSGAAASPASGPTGDTSLPQSTSPKAAKGDGEEEELSNLVMKKFANCPIRLFQL